MLVDGRARCSNERKGSVILCGLGLWSGGPLKKSMARKKWGCALAATRAAAARAAASPRGLKRPNARSASIKQRTDIATETTTVLPPFSRSRVLHWILAPAAALSFPQRKKNAISVCWLSRATPLSLPLSSAPRGYRRKLCAPEGIVGKPPIRAERFAPPPLTKLPTELSRHRATDDAGAAALGSSPPPRHDDHECAPRLARRSSRDDDDDGR